MYITIYACFTEYIDNSYDIEFVFLHRSFRPHVWPILSTDIQKDVSSYVPIYVCECVYVYTIQKTKEQ